MPFEASTSLAAEYHSEKLARKSFNFLKWLYSVQFFKADYEAIILIKLVESINSFNNILFSYITKPFLKSQASSN